MLQYSIIQRCNQCHKNVVSITGRANDREVNNHLWNWTQGGGGSKMRYKFWDSIIHFAVKDTRFFYDEYDLCESVRSGVPVYISKRTKDMSFSAAACYMKKFKDFVRKWMNRYKEVKKSMIYQKRGKRALPQKSRIKLSLSFLRSTLSIIYGKVKKSWSEKE